MKIWQKIILLIGAILVIIIFIHWWMSYEPMAIEVINNSNESVNASIKIFSADGREFLNKSFLLKANESIAFKNITNIAGEYFVNANINNESVEKKIKFGKYYEKIGIVFNGKEIEVKNERE